MSGPHAQWDNLGHLALTGRASWTLGGHLRVGQMLRVYSPVIGHTNDNNKQSGRTHIEAAMGARLSAPVLREP